MNQPTRQQSMAAIRRMMKESYKNTLFLCKKCKKACVGWDEMNKHSRDLAHRDFDTFQGTGQGLMLA